MIRICLNFYIIKYSLFTVGPYWRFIDGQLRAIGEHKSMQCFPLPLHTPIAIIFDKRRSRNFLPLAGHEKLHQYVNQWPTLSCLV